MCEIILVIINHFSEHITDWIMIIITAVYVYGTFKISKSNQESAKAARDAVEQSKIQFDKNLEASRKQFNEIFGASVQLFVESVGISDRQLDRKLELQRQLNIDSVRPAVSVDFASSPTSGGFCGNIYITNHGLGPAILKEMTFKKGDNGYKNSNGYCTFLDLVCKRAEEEGLQLPVEEIFYRCYSQEFRNTTFDGDFPAVFDGDFLAVKESLLLLEFETRNQIETDAVAKIFNGVTMELTYTDIYGKLKGIVSKRLSYFSPNWVGSQDIKNYMNRS